RCSSKISIAKGRPARSSRTMRESSATSRQPQPKARCEPSGSLRRARPPPKRSHLRRFVRRHRRHMKPVALAAVSGLAATVLAAGLAASGSAAVTAFEWSLYERWLRQPASPGPAPVIIVRDAASESRFGSGPWDRAVLASLVTTMSRAGAAVIGLD